MRQADQYADEIPSFSEASRAAKDALRVAGRRARATVNELSDDAYETSARARDTLAARVEEQPLAAVALAAGIGLIVGLLWSRH
jgi:ElaB/YqjD/DUF883 family membrane-anchored ribosome-binding protein